LDADDRLAAARAALRARPPGYRLRADDSLIRRASTFAQTSMACSGASFRAEQLALPAVGAARRVASRPRRPGSRAPA
jgi:hypothetical protein